MKPEQPKVESIYDSNDYYHGAKRGARLAVILNPLLHLFDWSKVGSLWRKISPKRGLVLDVGAGDGHYLACMRRLGHQVYGTTASKTSQQAAQDNLGIALYYGVDIPPDFCENRFQVISYWHVFEHIEKPLEHAVLWSRLLDTDGTLVIEVPNIDGLGARLCYKSWLGSDDAHHINQQKPEAIRRLLVENGLTIICEEQASLKFSYVFLWSAVLGFLFGAVYNFDFLMHILKAPLEALRQKPVSILNAMLSVFYLCPVILVLLVWGVVTQRGEIFRVFARRAR